MPTHIPSRQATEDESFRTIINEYRDFLSHQAMAPSSIESYLGRSRHFLIWLNRNGLGLSEVDGEVVVRFQAHDCTCFGRSCARPKHSPARTPGSSPSRVMWFVRFLELSGRASTPGELEGNLALVPAFLHELRRQGYTQSRIDRFRYRAAAPRGPLNAIGRPARPRFPVRALDWRDRGRVARWRAVMGHLGSDGNRR